MRLTALVLGILLPALEAQAVEPPQKLVLSTSYEQWALPNHETMGVASLGLHQVVDEYFSLGLVSYTAVRGERGGFITIGAAGGFTYPLGSSFAFDSGLFAGGGGGRGGYLLSGGGLMLRAHAGVKYTLPSWGDVGVGVSRVSFPNNGVIESTQGYVSFTVPIQALLESGGHAGGERQAGSFDLSQYHSGVPQFSLVARGVRVDKGTKRDQGGGLQADFGMLGVQWRSQLSDLWFAQVQAVGGGGGASAGYMHLLAGVGARAHVTNDLQAYASLAIGGGGGGGVATGGGGLIDGSVGLQYFYTPNAFVDVSVSKLDAPSASFASRTLNLSLGYQFGSVLRTKVDPALDLDGHALRVRVGQQRYTGANPNWRSRPNQSVDNLGFQLDYFLSPTLFMTGQGIGAYDGDAGAYMAGLVGAGLHAKLGAHFFAEAEGLVGVAGGGGLAVGSGVVRQINASVGYQFKPSLGLMLTAGDIRSSSGSFHAHTLGTALVYRFNAFSVP